MSGNSKTRVLIIDDEDFIRKMIKLLLETLDCEVVGEAKDGAEGVKMYKAAKPDLVLLDIQMPVMDGLETLKNIMEFDKAASVAMLTAIDHTMLHDDARMMGAKCYIQKDTQPELMKERIAQQIAAL